MSKKIGFSQENQPIESAHSIGSEELDDEKTEDFIWSKVDLYELANEYKKNEGISVEAKRGGVVCDMVEDLARLVLELKDKLADYSVIISDDASGRLPSLFFRRLINKERKKNNEPGVKTYFIAGGRHDSQMKYDNIKKFLKQKIGSKDKVMVVTEYIETGRSINKLLQIIESLGIDFDLVAVSAYADNDFYSEYPLIKEHMICGGDNHGGAYFHGYVGNSVIKNSSGLPYPVKDYAPQGAVNKARRNVAFLADKLSILLD